MTTKKKFYVVVRGEPSQAEWLHDSACSSIFADDFNAISVASDYELDYEVSCMVIEYEFTLEELEVLHKDLDACHGCGWAKEEWDSAEEI